MGQPIRYQQIGEVRFYRMGTTLIADKSDKTFVVLQYADKGGFEATVRTRAGLRMPILGDTFPTRREALAYLLPHYQAA